MRKIAIIKIYSFNTYKTIFEGPDNNLTKNLIKLLIKTFNYSYRNNIAIAFILNDELDFYIAPEEFLNSEV